MGNIAAGQRAAELGRGNVLKIAPVYSDQEKTVRK